MNEFIGVYGFYMKRTTVSDAVRKDESQRRLAGFSEDFPLTDVLPPNRSTGRGFRSWVIPDPLGITPAPAERPADYKHC